MLNIFYKYMESIFTNYPEEYFEFSQNNTSWVQTERPALNRFFNEYLVNRDITSLNYLVAGCGWGREMAYLTEKKISPNNIVGIDMSKPLVSKGAQLFPEFNYIVGDISQIPLNDQTQDVIISSMVTQYLDRQHLSNFISEARRLVKPSGLLFIHAVHPFWERFSDSYGDMEPIQSTTPWGFSTVTYPHPVEDFSKIFVENRFSIGLYEHSRPKGPEYVPQPEKEQYSPHRISYILEPY